MAVVLTDQFHARSGSGAHAIDLLPPNGARMYQTTADLAPNACSSFRGFLSPDRKPCARQATSSLERGVVASGLGAPRDGVR